MLHFVCNWDWQIRQYFPPLHKNTCMPLHAVPAKGSQQIMWHHEIISEISGVPNLFSGNNKCVSHSSLPTLKHLLDNWCEMTKARKQAWGMEREGERDGSISDSWYSLNFTAHVHRLNSVITSFAAWKPHYVAFAGGDFHNFQIWTSNLVYL